nr:hypothetical protein [Schwartzia sp. (in: firmicutes)]
MHPLTACGIETKNPTVFRPDFLFARHQDYDGLYGTYEFIAQGQASNAGQASSGAEGMPEPKVERQFFKFTAFPRNKKALTCDNNVRAFLLQKSD